MDYSTWRACERLGILPPGVLSDYEDNPAWIQQLILAYNQVRSVEEQSSNYEFLGHMFKALRG